MKENLDLNQRLQQKLDLEREIIQKLTQRSYDKLQKELEAITNTATNTIKKDMERQHLDWTSWGNPSVPLGQNHLIDRERDLR